MSEATKDHGVLFRGELVRGFLAGRKSQTRRLPHCMNSMVNGFRCLPPVWSRLDFDSIDVFVDDGPSPAGNPGPYLHVPLKLEFRDEWGDGMHRVYPTYQPGDRVWVKETWRTIDREDGSTGVLYRANDRFVKISNPKQWIAQHEKRRGDTWRSSMLMPKWAARIWLKVVRVRAQRLQEISEADVLAEGIDKFASTLVAATQSGETRTLVPAYRALWEQINGAGSWTSNPWLWAIDFEPLAIDEGYPTEEQQHGK